MSEIDDATQMAQDAFEFSLAEKGLTRFPPNVEQISVEHESLRSWLVMRRNDIVLRFPLSTEACRHLAELLVKPPTASGSRSP